jgi:hypothetical protein
VSVFLCSWQQTGIPKEICAGRGDNSNSQNTQRDRYPTQNLGSKPLAEKESDSLQKQIGVM